MAEQEPTLMVQNPVPYLDKLAANDAGNTPRPSEALNKFYQGMRKLPATPGEAEKLLLEGVAEAKKHVDDAKAQKIDWERMAIVRMGLGYTYVQMNDIKKAEKHYKISLQYWIKTLGGLHPAMAGLLRDVATVFMHNQKWDDSLNTLKGLATIINKTKGAKTVEMAETVCRMGMVLGEMEGKADEAKKHFEKAAQCASATSKSENVAALAHVLEKHLEFLRKLQAAGSDVSAEVASVQEALQKTQPAAQDSEASEAAPVAE